jgi:hypothetical protein
MVDYIVDHPTNTFTMVVLFTATLAWLWRIIHPYPWKPLRGRGTVKALWQGFIYADQPRNKLITKLYDQLLSVPKQLNHTSPMVRTPRISYSFTPPPFQHVFGWLLCINFLIRSN